MLRLIRYFLLKCVIFRPILIIPAGKPVLYRHIRHSGEIQEDRMMIFLLIHAPINAREALI